MKKIAIILGMTFVFFCFISLQKSGEEVQIQSENKKIEEIKEEEIKEIQIYDIEEGYLTVPAVKNAKKHVYNWNNIKFIGNYKYYEDDNYKTHIGIDVSTYQGEIDWEKVKKSGIEFAIIRLGFRGYGTSGKLVLDDRFEEYVDEACNAGIKVGVYFFSQAINVQEAEEEAEFVLEHIKNKKIEYPICYDLEKIKYVDTARANNLKKEERTQNAITFCNYLNQKGYKTMLYANAKWLTTELELEKLNNYSIWYADYQDKPLYPYHFEMWQYTEAGTVNGINGNVDLNLYFEKK